jgi:tRNA-modifying protein YgfZ
MNQYWLDFLNKAGATYISADAVLFPDCSDNLTHWLYPIVNLGVISVSGSDAAHFLQGQITCDINTITESECSLGAFCTPKGRVISTFLLIKKWHHFLIILPLELLDVIKKRLQLYILRADVQLADSSEEFSLIGFDSPAKSIAGETLPDKHFSVTKLNRGTCISLPSPKPRYLVLSTPETAVEIWSKLIEKNHFTPASSDRWDYLNILSGIPWLNLQTTEEFIPQMLNLDKLGGISFEKGCYTGQEIVARTHYLGKSKRRMYLATYNTACLLGLNSAIIDHDNSDQKAGNIISIRQTNNSKESILLCVLQTKYAQSKNLRIQNHVQIKIAVTELYYMTQ